MNHVIVLSQHTIHRIERKSSVLPLAPHRGPGADRQPNNGRKRKVCRHVMWRASLTPEGHHDGAAVDALPARALLPRVQLGGRDSVLLCGWWSVHAGEASCACTCTCTCHKRLERPPQAGSTHTERQRTDGCTDSRAIHTLRQQTNGRVCLCNAMPCNASDDDDSRA